MKINRQRLKEIIKSAMSEEKEYEEFFRSELEKAGFSSPAEMSDAEKREFFNKIDADWDAKNEELTGNQHKLDIDGDGDIEADDLAALRAGKKKEKSSNEGNAFGAAVTKAKKEGDKKFKVGGKAYPVKEQKSKYYVEIDSPREVDSNRVKGEIKSFMKKGARSVDIGLRMNFLTTDPKDMMAKFQKVKNHIYFANDTRRFESVNEVIKTYKPGDGDELANMFSDHLKGAEKFYYMLDVINALRKNNILTKQVAHKMELELAKKYAVKNPVSEGYHVVRKGKQEAWISDKSYANLMKGKDVVGYIIDNEGGHDEVWVSKKDIVKVSKSNDALAKVADKYSKFESVKRMSEGKKTFKVNPQIGVVKYSISFHDGVGANKDGSAFSDLKTYKNKVELEAGIKDFKSKGYVMESVKRMSEGKYDKDLDKVEAAVEAAIKTAVSFTGIGAELKKAGIKYDFSTSMVPMYRIKVPGNTIAIVSKRYTAHAEREVAGIAIGLLEGKIGRSLKVENLSPDVAKHMIGIYKGFSLVNGDGTMTYDTPANAKKAADYLNKNKIAASTDGKYLYIESKTRR
jgi:hypothetical protein